MKSMTIARLAAQGEVGVETVRYYQRRGLMAEPARGGAPGPRAIRRYDESDARRLRFIRTAQTAGFTLEQIRELLDLDAMHDRGRVLAMADRQLGILDRKIADLTAARQRLARLATKCSAAAPGPCPILLAFDN